MPAMDKKIENEQPKIAGDRLNILLLIFLFTLQSIPRGMSNAVPLILQSKKTSYGDQAEISLVQYPYCLKLLWAPIVDCVYSKKIGRRKTWIVPVLYLVGIVLYVMSSNVNDWFGNNDTQRPKVRCLTVTFFLCISLCATLEITFDAWALTMLKKRNIGHAGTCNNTGYVLSLFFGFVLFIILDSKDFSNRFRTVPQDYGFVTFADFTFFWAMMCFIASTYVLFFKRDNSLDVIEDTDECRLTIKESYKRLWNIMKIPQIRALCCILLTYQIGLGPSNGVARLKLMDAGVPSDTFALLTAPSLPLVLVFPFFLGRYLTAHRSLHAFVVVYLIKLILGLVYGVFIFITPFVREPNNAFPSWHYWLLLLIYNIDAVVDHSMYVTIYAFFSRISDPRFGGMYATLLHGTSNIGFRWPISLCLWLVDKLTIEVSWEKNMKSMHFGISMFDGYFIETVLFFAIGVVWLCWSKKKIYELQDMDPSVWILETKSKSLLDDRKLSTN